MRLNEILNAPASDSKWTDALQALIDKHGLKQFSGQQAVVITSDDRRVVYRIWVKDVGYERWLKVAEQMQTNPHIVKVLGKLRTIRTRFKGLPKDLQLKFVKLEKLDHLFGDETLEAFIFRVSEVINGWSVPERNEHNIDSFIKTIDAQSETWDATSVFEAIKKLTEKHRSFLETVLELSRKGYNDWSIDNIMLRGDTLVIVDPLAAN